MNLVDLPSEILLDIRDVLLSHEPRDVGCPSWPECQWSAAVEARFCTSCNLEQSPLKRFSMACKALRSLCAPVLFRTILFQETWNQERLAAAFESAMVCQDVELYTQRLLISNTLEHGPPPEATDKSIRNPPPLNKEQVADWFCTSLNALIKRIPHLRDLGLVLPEYHASQLRHMLEDGKVRFETVTHLWISGELLFILPSFPHLVSLDIVPMTPFKDTIWKQQRLTDNELASMSAQLQPLQHVGLLYSSWEMLDEPLGFISSVSSLSINVEPWDVWTVGQLISSLSNLPIALITLELPPNLYFAFRQRDGDDCLKPYASLFLQIPSLKQLWFGKSLCCTMKNRETMVLHVERLDKPILSVETLLLGLSVGAAQSNADRKKLFTYYAKSNEATVRVRFSPSGLWQISVRLSGDEWDLHWASIIETQP